jgi:16S rRNA processing protein RimM
MLNLNQQPLQKAKLLPQKDRLKNSLKRSSANANPVLAFFISHMNLRDFFKVGYVLKPHGLKGEVTVALDHDLPLEIEEVDSVFVEINNNLVPHQIESISARGAKAIVKFEDVDSIAAANVICKRSLFLPKSSRPKSGRGEFYDDEIVGFEVFDETYGSIGKVAAVTAAGLNKLLSIDHLGKEILIPLNSPFIKSVNKTKKKIAVDLPEGFLEI